MNTCLPLSRWGAAKWQKGIHAVNSEAYRLGADRRVVERVSQVLGTDIQVPWIFLSIIEPPMPCPSKGRVHQEILLMTIFSTYEAARQFVCCLNG